MTKIKIKRATSEGLKECEGRLIQVNGFQYCFTKADDFYCLIKLSSGGLASPLVPSFFHKWNEALKISKESVSKRTVEEITEALEKFKQKYGKVYGFQFPINDYII